MRLPNLVGPTYTTRSINYGCEQTINWYPEYGEQGAAPKTRGCLLPTPGLQQFIRANEEFEPTTGINNGPVRGLFYQDGRCFAVSGNLFVEILSSRTWISRGLVAEDGNPATMCSNGQAGHQIFVTSGGLGYIFDLVANTFTNITADGFPVPCVMGAFVDQYFLALKGQSIQYNISNLANGLAWDGLDVGQVSETSDNKIALLTNHREVWLFGSKTTEVWYNSGNAGFPFQPIQGTLIEHGIAAPFTATRLDNTIFWLGADETGARVVWRAQGYVPQRISNHAIEYFLNLAPNVAAATAYAYQEDGHSFYVLNVPGINVPIDGEVTLVYDVATGQWHCRGLWNDRTERYELDLPRCHAFAFDRYHLMGDRQSGTVYQSSLELFDYSVVVT